MAPFDNVRNVTLSQILPKIAPVVIIFDQLKITALAATPQKRRWRADREARKMPRSADALTVLQLLQTSVDLQGRRARSRRCMRTFSPTPPVLHRIALSRAFAGVVQFRRSRVPH